MTCKNCPGQALDAAYDGVQVTVDITAPHRNAFAGVVGMPTWDVGVTATSQTGWIDTAIGPGPFIVSTEGVRRRPGSRSSCTGQGHQCDLEHPVDDTPSECDEFAWTDFSYDKHVRGDGQRQRQRPPGLHGRPGGASRSPSTFGCYIAQHNNGVMNNIVKRLEDLAPITFPVPVVDEEGKFVGWATFVADERDPGGRNGTITGYFKTDSSTQQLDVRSPGFGTATFGGSYRLKLIN